MPEEKALQDKKIKIWVRLGGEPCEQALEAIRLFKKRITEELPLCECIEDIVTPKGWANVIVDVDYSPLTGNITRVVRFVASTNSEDFAFREVRCAASFFEQKAEINPDRSSQLGLDLDGERSETPEELMKRAEPILKGMH